MLSPAPPPPQLTTTPTEAEMAGPGMRICTICEGPAQLPMLAAYLADLPPLTNRRDLALADALASMRAHQGPGYDRIILVPDWQIARTHPLLHAVLAVAAPLAAQLILLAPPEGGPHASDLPFSDLPDVILLHGPPFRIPGEPSLPPPPQKATTSLWSRLFTRSSGLNPEPPAEPPPPKPAPRIIAIQPLCGGAGATLLTTALAQEIAQAPGTTRIAILDLDLQFGSAATYLNLPGEPRVDDAYRNLATMDAEALQSCLQSAGDSIRLFAAPTEILPLDGMTGPEAARLVTLAAEAADLVLIDLPHAITDWSGAIFALADLVIGVALVDVRSARNSSRLRMLLKAEGLPPERLTYVINRIPLRQGHGARAELAEFIRGLRSAPLGQIPEGGPVLTDICNGGQPLCRAAPGNPARLAIRKLAEGLIQAPPAPATSLGGR